MSRRAPKLSRRERKARRRRGPQTTPPEEGVRRYRYGDDVVLWDGETLRFAPEAPEGRPSTAGLRRPPKHLRAQLRQMDLAGEEARRVAAEGRAGRGRAIDLARDGKIEVGEGGRRVEISG